MPYTDKQNLIRERINQNYWHRRMLGQFGGESEPGEILGDTWSRIWNDVTFRFIYLTKIDDYYFDENKSEIGRITGKASGICECGKKLEVDYQEIGEEGTWHHPDPDDAQNCTFEGVDILYGKLPFGYCNCCSSKEIWKEKEAKANQISS